MIHDDELDGRLGLIETVQPAAMRWRNGLAVVMRTAMIAVGGITLLFLLIPTATRCGESARRAQCLNNLKQIQIALQGYHQKYGTFPPAYVADADGRRLHSWRVLILPFMDPFEDDHEFRSLYERYDLAEPWDGPHNIRMLDAMPGVFRCPSRNPHPKGGTSYVAITGPGTMFPGASSVRAADVTDGLASTLSVVEAVDLPVPWTAPLDLDVRTMAFEDDGSHRAGIAGPHPDGVNVATGDGMVHTLKTGIAPVVLRAMTTISGGERIDVKSVWGSR